jgi:lysophospholipase L1-like esterase
MKDPVNKEPKSPPPPPRRRKKWLAKLLLLGATCLFMLLVGEVLVRIFSPPLIMPRWVENGPHGIRKQLPNIRGRIVTTKYRHNLSTNSKGFRGTNEYAVAKPTNVFRVVALGDSVVNGYGSEDHQNFSALLEQQLSAVKPAEVINMGIPGFSSAEELIQLQKVALDYQPDLVVLGYFVNDHFENLTCGLYSMQDGKLVRNAQGDDPAIYVRDRLSRVPGYNFLCQHSYLVNALRNKASGVFRGKLAGKHKIDGGAFTTDKPSEEMIVLTCALVDEIIKTCHDRGIKIIILNIPTEIDGAWMQNLPVDRLQLKNEAVIVDVAEQIWNKRPIQEVAFGEHNLHPRPLAHQLIADWLMDYIQKKIW